MASTTARHRSPRGSGPLGPPASLPASSSGSPDSNATPTISKAMPPEPNATTSRSGVPSSCIATPRLREASPSSSPPSPGRCSPAGRQPRGRAWRTGAAHSSAPIWAASHSGATGHRRSRPPPSASMPPSTGLATSTASIPTPQQRPSAEPLNSNSATISAAEAPSATASSSERPPQRWGSNSTR